MRDRQRALVHGTPGEGRDLFSSLPRAWSAPGSPWRLTDKGTRHRNTSGTCLGPLARSGLGPDATATLRLWRRVRVATGVPELGTGAPGGRGEARGGSQGPKEVGSATWRDSREARGGSPNPETERESDQEQETQAARCPAPARPWHQEGRPAASALEAVGGSG